MYHSDSPAFWKHGENEIFQFFQFGQVETVYSFSKLPHFSYTHLWSGCSGTHHQGLLWGLKTIYRGTCTMLNTQRDGCDQVCPKWWEEYPQSYWWVSEMPHSDTPGDKRWPQVPLKALRGSANRSGSDSECLVSTGDLQHDCPRPGMDKCPFEGCCPWNRTWASS